MESFACLSAARQPALGSPPGVSRLRHTRLPRAPSYFCFLSGNDIYTLGEKQDGGTRFEKRFEGGVLAEFRYFSSSAPFEKLADAVTTASQIPIHFESRRRHFCS